MRRETRRTGAGGKRPLKTLERALSKAGLGSRTEARAWIGAGRVRVNGKLIQSPDHWVDLERDRITLDGQPVTRRKKTYILLYKPTGYVTTYKDPQGRPTVYDLLPEGGEFVFPVGRLDLDTSGLLILTNDSQFAERLTNPKYKVPKTYLVKTATRLEPAALDLLRQRPGLGAEGDVLAHIDAAQVDGLALAHPRHGDVRQRQVADMARMHHEGHRHVLGLGMDHHLGVAGQAPMGLHRGQIEGVAHAGDDVDVLALGGHGGEGHPHRAVERDLARRHLGVEGVAALAGGDGRRGEGDEQADEDVAHGGGS